MIELGLDSRGFTDGQARAVRTFRQTERQVRDSAASISRSATTPLRQNFDQLNQNLVSLNQNFTNMSSQSRRSGAAVAAGATAGAVGMKNLALAGIEAYGALKTVQAVIGQVAAATERGASVSRAAWATGFPGGTRGLDTFIKAAEEAAHVPQATSIETINSYQQRIEENKRTGAWSQEFTELGRLGINKDDPILTQMKQMRAAMQGRSGPEAQRWMTAVGLGPLMQWLKLSEAEADSATRRAGQHSLTRDQGKALEELQTSAVRAQNSLGHLWETLTVKFSQTGLKDALDGVSQFTDAISNDEKAVSRLAAALSVLFGVLSLGIVSKIGKLLTGRSLLGGLLGVFGRFAGPLGILSGMAPGSANQGERDMSGFNTQGGGPRGNETFWQRWRRTFGTGGEDRQSSQIGQPVTGTGIGHIAPKSERLAFYRQYAESKRLNPDAIEATVRSEGLGRYHGDHGMSFGDFQLYTGGGMGNQALAAGIDVRNPKTWQDQGRFAIDQMAAHRNDPAWYAGQWHGARLPSGAPGWAAREYSNYKPGVGQPTAIIPQVKPEQAPVATAPIPPVMPLFDSPEGQAYRGAPSLPPLNLPSMIRRDQSSSNGPATINHGDVAINGGVHVHTPATDANGIAGSIQVALNEKLRNNIRVNGADSGMS